MRVGFVGLGSQGAPMALKIIEAGFPTTLWARRPETLVTFAGTDATVATNLRELGAQSDVLCVCVVGDSDVDEVLRGSNGALKAMRAGSFVAIHSTVEPPTCRRLQEDFPALRFIDAPVSGGGHKAAERELVVMAGGSAADVEHCRPIFETYGDPIVHLGALGAGQEAKLLNNVIFTAQLEIAAEAFALAATKEMDLAAMATVLAFGSGRSYAADVVAGSGFDVSALGSVAGPLLAKDVALAVRHTGLSQGALRDAAEAAIRSMGATPAGSTEGRP